MQPDSISAGGAMQVEERQSIIKEFEWSITELQEVVEELHIRLVPVTRSESTVDMLGEKIIPTSEARSRLHDLQGTTASLRSLLARLEV